MRHLQVVSSILALPLMMSTGACGGGAPAPHATAGGEAPVTAMAAPAAGASPSVQKQFEDFDPKRFDRSTEIDNEWWPLTPGTQFVYEGSSIENDERVPHRLVITVSDLTKMINGVRTVVVYEKDYDGDQLVESELAFFAQDNDGNVWHLGQYRETYDEKEFVGGRTFLVGHLEGARAGIMMPAEPRVGTASYSQGYGPPPFNWTDRGRVYQIGQKTRVPAGSYDDILVIEEYNDEEPGAFQLKYHARGVGVIRVGWRGKDPNQEELVLHKIGPLAPAALAQVRTEAKQLETRAYVYGTTPPAEPNPAVALRARGTAEAGGNENGIPARAASAKPGAGE